MLRNLFSLLVYSCVPVIALSQLPDSTADKIDRIFASYNNLNTPGCAVAVVRNDSVLFAKGYGMANLEYSTPVNSRTIFHVASVSKQFTAFATVLLAKQGKLSLDDDVRKYLSWFPNLHHKITIRQLLNHTSGIRDQWQLMAMSGTRLDDVITQRHIVKLLSRQQALNFTPGEQFMYCNSGFTMLAEIVESVSGQSLRRFMDSAVFRPLKMSNTHFHDDYQEIVKDRADSYNKIDSTHYSNSVLSYSNTGATSLFTNVEDMSKWIMNFFKPTVGSAQDILTLTEKGKLNNNTVTNYALGISVDSVLGQRSYSHSGGDAGFRSFLSVFPDLKMGFVIFSNNGEFDPGGRLMDVARVFIKDTANKQPTQPDSALAVLADTSVFSKFRGDYITSNGFQFNLNLRDRRMYISFRGRERMLVPLAGDTMSIPGSNVKLIFKNQQVWWAPNNELQRAEPISIDPTPSEKQLREYTGAYYSEELATKYSIVLKDNQLYLLHNKYEDAKITPLGKDHLRTENWWMAHLLAKRDKKGKIVGFDVNSGRVLNVRFDRQ